MLVRSEEAGLVRLRCNAQHVHVYKATWAYPQWHFIPYLRANPFDGTVSKAQYCLTYQPAAKLSCRAEPLLNLDEGA